MDTPIIEVNSVGKKYSLTQYNAHQVLLREAISSNFEKIFAKRSTQNRNNSFWALKNVSFTVYPGEVIGIIGKNGAGKSTLLKILSRITIPTEGSIKIRGVVGSLLEVGTGFHPELSGRENIYLSGSILGMQKNEINENFDKIVKFADIEKFLDTPVKRYSSGMMIRLGFSVASHLNPDVLVVDEVLAVGDAQFQKKCLGKMDQISKSEGRTILFVSHNMSMISSLCNSGILLDKGSIQFSGSIERVVNYYLNTGQIGTGEVFFKENMPGDNKAVLHSIRVLDAVGNPTIDSQINKPFFIEMDYELFEDRMRVYPNLLIKDYYGQYVFTTSDSGMDADSTKKMKAGRYISRCKIPGNFLNAGTFYIGAALTSIYPLHVHFWEQDVVFITINDPIEGIPTRGTGYHGPIPGPIRPLLEWELR